MSVATTIWTWCWSRVKHILFTSRMAWLKRILFAVPVLIIGIIVFLWQESSVKAAGIASGFSALVAITAALYVLHPRLNYWLLPRETRRKHNEYVAWQIEMVNKAWRLLLTSGGTAGNRTEALMLVYLVSRSLPGSPPIVLEEHYRVQEDIEEMIANYRKTAESVIGSKEKLLEDPRLMYQYNLIRALGFLLHQVGYELGGHGYVTEVWEKNLNEWGVCAARQHRALERPLGAAAGEEQLLNLLDRLLAHDFNKQAYRSLTQGDLVRIRISETEWTVPLKLTSVPIIINRHETGFPIWRLEVEDAAETKAAFDCDRTAFEPAPMG